MFWGNNDADVDNKDRKTMNMLDAMELSWNEDQKSKQSAKLQSNIEKKQRSNDFVDALLIKCKNHGGPVTTVADIQAISDKSYLRQEVQFQRVTHPRDVAERPALYKINGLTADEMAANLITMLDSGLDDVASSIFLCEDEIMTLLIEPLNEATSNNPTSSKPTFEFQQPVAVVWDEPGDKKQWYIGFYLGEADKTNTFFRIDHVQRKGRADDIWQRPVIDDVQDVDISQIIPCVIEGSWDFNGRAPYFILNNHKDIKGVFLDMYT